MWSSDEEIVTSKLRTRLDRICWAGAVSLEVYGARIGIRVNEASLLPEIANSLPPLSKSISWELVDEVYSLWATYGTSPRRRLYRLYAGHGRVVCTADLREVCDVLQSMLHFAVAQRARGKLFVHAGVVGWRGRAIVIPGRSRSGKTSLVAALVRAGATYSSDEYAVFDESGWVHPYPKRLSFRDEVRGERQRESPKMVAVEELGGTAGQEAMPVGLIVVTNYRPGAVWQPQSISGAATTLALIDNTVVVREQPQLTLSTLRLAVESAVALKSERGDARGLAPELLSALVDR